MSDDRWHDDEVPVSMGAVERMLRRQCSAWSGLPLAVQPGGSDNWLFRLGRDKVVRIPRHPRAVAGLLKEQTWLPRLATALPLALPVPLFDGCPDEDCAFPWSVCRWVDGEDAWTAPIGDSPEAAEALAGFLHALWRCGATDGPAPGPHNSCRGVPLAQRDDGVRQALRQLGGRVDAGKALAVWEAALAAAPAASAVWIHGDLHPANLVAAGGRLAGVVDWGCLGVGDPACDVMAAWMVFNGAARLRFRQALDVDGDAWARGRGWALSVAAIALPYYEKTASSLAGIAARALREVLGG